MKFLVPLELTNASLCGFKYAERLSYELGAELSVLNIIPSGPQSKIQKAQRKAEKRLRLRKIKSMTRDYPDLCEHKMAGKVDTEYYVDFGSIAGNILKHVNRYKFDMMIIGTRAKHNIFEYLFGSITTELIRRINIPVLVVPEGTSWGKIKNISLAIDLNMYELNNEIFINSLASALGANLTLVNVKNTSNNDEINTEYHILIEDQDYDETDVTVVKNPSIIKGLDHYIDEHQSDLLALKIPKRNRATDLIHRSLSKALVFHTQIPLLLYH